MYDFKKIKYHESKVLVNECCEENWLNIKKQTVN